MSRAIGPVVFVSDIVMNWNKTTLKIVIKSM